MITKHRDWWWITDNDNDCDWSHLWVSNQQRVVRETLLLVLADALAYTLYWHDFRSSYYVLTWLQFWFNWTRSAFVYTRFHTCWTDTPLWLLTGNHNLFSHHCFCKWFDIYSDEVCTCIRTPWSIDIMRYSMAYVLTFAFSYFMRHVRRYRFWHLFGYRFQHIFVPNLILTFVFSRLRRTVHCGLL